MKNFQLLIAGLFVIIGAVSCTTTRVSTKPRNRPSETLRGETLVCPDSVPCNTKKLSPDSVIADVDYDVLFGGDFGNARSLLSGSVLKSGEPFTVFLYSRKKNVYAYLFHENTAGNTTELISRSALLGGKPCTTANLLPPWKLVELPSRESYYELDGDPGVERLYVVISVRPICTLGVQGASKSRYNFKDTLGRLVAHHGLISDDRRDKRREGSDKYRKCSMDRGVCIEEIVINHVSG